MGGGGGARCRRSGRTEGAAIRGHPALQQELQGRLLRRRRSQELFRADAAPASTRRRARFRRCGEGYRDALANAASAFWHRRTPTAPNPMMILRGFDRATRDACAEADPLFQRAGPVGRVQTEPGAAARAHRLSAINDADRGERGDALALAPSAQTTLREEIETRSEAEAVIASRETDEAEPRRQRTADVLVDPLAQSANVSISCRSRLFEALDAAEQGRRTRAPVARWRCRSRPPARASGMVCCRDFRLDAPDRDRGQ